MRRRTAISIFVLACILLAGCNLPRPGAPDQPDLALTLTALQSGAPGPGAGQPSETPAPPPVPTEGLTSTPSVPQVTVSQNTNCRSGPGLQFDLISALLIGQTAEIIGKNSGVPNYWVIKDPQSSGTCWLWGQYATVAGNVSALPEIAVPPTPTPSPTPTPAIPLPVKNLTANKICIPLPGPLEQYLGTIDWESKADNEKGFHIFMNGGLFATLPPDSVSYPLPGLIFGPGTAIKYGVETFNDAGKSVTKEVTISCP